MPDLAPMLAATGLPASNLEDWAVEPKIDGWRCRTTVDNGTLIIRTRRGRVITEFVPELHGLADCGHQLLVDGELCARAGRLADFAGLSGRLAGRPRAGSVSVSLVVFDILWLDGRQLTGERYDRRRKILCSLKLEEIVTAVGEALPSDALLLPPTSELSGETPSTTEYLGGRGLAGRAFPRPLPHERGALPGADRGPMLPEQWETRERHR